MRKFDILSQPPKTFIFSRISNKTNFGGFLTFIYLFIMIFITIYFVYNYIIGDKYEYFYSYRELPEEQKKKFFNGFDPNPPINLKLDVINELDWNISSNLKFIIYEKNSEEKIIYRNSWTEFIVPNYVVIDLYYSSEDINNFTVSDIKDLEFGETFLVNLTYRTFYLDHQNPKCPFKKIYLNKYLRFNFERNFVLYLNWEFTKYKERNDIFKIFSNYLRRPIQFLDGRFTVGDLKEEKNEGLYNDLIIEGKLHAYLGSIVILNTKDTIHEYLRQKKEWLNVLATISALGNTFYSLFVRIFYLIYSKKYDHYKIFKNILLLDSTIKRSKALFVSEATNLQLNNFSIDKKVVEEKTLEVQEIQVISSNKSDNSSSNNNDKGSDCDKEDKDDESEINSLDLHKLPFIDFMFNNLYKDKCCNSTKQKLISLSSQIIYKYYSIEHILFNLLKLENLLSDYKWNNPKLKTIQNNKTILEMRNNMQI